MAFGIAKVRPLLLKTSPTSGGDVGGFMATASKVRDETWEFMKLLASKENVRMEAGVLRRTSRTRSGRWTRGTRGT